MSDLSPRQGFSLAAFVVAISGMVSTLAVHSDVGLVLSPAVFALLILSLVNWNSPGGAP